MTEPTPLTDAEKCLQKVLCQRRNTFSGKTRVSPCREDTLRRLNFGAHLGGSIYSLYGGFDAEQQLEWAMRALAYLTEDRIAILGHHEINLDYDSEWVNVVAVATSMVNETFETDRTAMQEEFNKSGGLSEFRKWNSEARVNAEGTVTDAWGSSYKAEADWFLDNMTQALVFTLFQLVNEDVQDYVAENIGWWAEGGEDSKITDVAAKAFTTLMMNLSDHINEALADAA